MNNSVGGLGSGRDYWGIDTKTEAEECDIISSTEWYRKDLITDGMKRKKFSVSAGDKTTTYDVKLEWTDCNFGGSRPWFICPEKNCSRRVEKLYRPPGEKYYFCRHCWDLTYERCNISGDKWKIKGYKLRKIREYLRKKSKAEDYDIGPEIYKPKDMHWRTYLRIEKQYYRLMREYMDLFKQDMRDRRREFEKLVD